MSCPVCQLPTAESTSGRECPFCGAVFSRVDGARRHAKCCPLRAGRPLHAGKRGRKARSCDECSRVKVHCNAPTQGPCERCAARGLDCVFSRRCTDAAHHRPPAHEGNQRERPHAHGRVPLSFLLNFTDDTQRFVSERAVGEEPEGSLLGPTCVTPPQAPARSDETLDYIDPTLLLPSEPLELGGLYDTEEQSLLGAFLSPASQEDRLSARLDLLEQHVGAHASSSDRHRDSFDAAAFRSFFSASNVHTFATVFCRKRHYQYPVIHWPTFVLDEASLPLLMVVALTGATYSYRPGHGPEHITEARKLYQLADSYVFTQLAAFLEEVPSGFDVAEAIQVCQAAVLMYALDTLSTAELAMLDVAMTERLPALIAAMRRLQFIGCRHDPDEDWQLFLHREHIIRLVSWTFCSDCLATLCCNNPPVFTLLEMSGELPCDPALWDADSTAAFELLRCSWQGASYSLKDLMSRLLDDNWHQDCDWDSLPLFHLHAMLCGKFPTHINSTPLTDR